MQCVKRRLHEILSGAGSGDKVGRIVDKALFALILLNILAVILETVESLSVYPTVSYLSGLRWCLFLYLP